jgi:hypothetical protein
MEPWEVRMNAAEQKIAVHDRLLVGGYNPQTNEVEDGVVQLVQRGTRNSAFVRNFLIYVVSPATLAAILGVYANLFLSHSAAIAKALGHP